MDIEEIETRDLIAQLNTRGYGCIHLDYEDACSFAENHEIENEFYYRDLQKSIGATLEEDLNLEPSDVVRMIELIGDVKLGGDEWRIVEKLKSILEKF